MIWRKFGVLASLIIMLVTLTPITIYANEGEPSKDMLEKVEAYVNEQFAKAGITGGSDAIVYKDQIVDTNGIGYSDDEVKTKATSKTIYSIASVTKSLTATAILQLAEQGKLKLDDPVQNYLPWFSYEDKKISKAVTIKHLLIHSPGVNRFQADGSIFTNEKENRNSLENAVRALNTVEVSGTPGEKGQYCNSCFNELGLIIEKVSGMSYYDYMHKFVFQPLNLNQSFYGYELTNHPHQDVAKEYSWIFGFKSDRLINFETFGKSQDPEGGIYTNVEDLALYVQAMLGYGKGNILPPDIMERSFEGIVPSEQEDWKYTFGGFTAGKLVDENILYKAGDGIGSSAAIMFLPEKDLGIVLIIGESNSEVKLPIVKGMLQILIGEEPSAVDSPITLFKLAGYVMLAVTILCGILLMWLIRLIIKRQSTRNKTIKYRWLHILLSVLFFVTAAVLGFILFTVRLTQIGFYGYPLDVAVGLISLFLTLFFWAMYHGYLSIFGKKLILVKEGIYMKKIIIFSIMIVAFMLTGCSVDVGVVTSKSEQFADQAEELGNQFDASKEKLEQLEGKETLVTKDLELIVKEMDHLTKSIDQFKEEEAPFLAKKVKKVVVKKLDEIEEVIEGVHEKAEKGTANHDDVKIIINALTDNIEFNLLGQ